MRVVSRLASRHPHIAQFVEAFKDATGCRLPFELAEIVLAHPIHTAKRRFLWRKRERAHHPWQRSLLLRDIARGTSTTSPKELVADETAGGIVPFLSALDSNRYKVRLARRLSKYIIVGENVPRPFPEPILVDTFEAMLGAAVLCDLRNLQPITDLI